MLSLHRKKESSEPMTITNKVASDEMVQEQQSSQTGEQQNIYDNPAPSDSLTITNNNASGLGLQ